VAPPLGCPKETADSLTRQAGRSNSVEYGYNALGRRSERRVNGQSTRYVYDGIQAMGEISEGSSPGTGCRS
jgi:YD repeat-containing protein